MKSWCEFYSPNNTELFLLYLSMFLKGPIYKELVRIFSPNNLIYEKSTFKR